jgi:hypothetical protein
MYYALVTRKKVERISNTTPKKMFNSTFFLPLIALKSAIKRAAIVSASSLIALLKCY